MTASSRSEPGWAIRPRSWPSFPVGCGASKSWRSWQAKPKRTCASLAAPMSPSASETVRVAGASTPYDRVLVTAAAERLPPAILDQIKPRGRIVLPLGSDEAQWLTVVDKGADGQTSVRELIRVRFSRLVTVV